MNGQTKDWNSTKLRMMMSDDQMTTTTMMVMMMMMMIMINGLPFSVHNAQYRCNSVCGEILINPNINYRQPPYSVAPTNSYTFSRPWTFGCLYYLHTVYNSDCSAPSLIFPISLPSTFSRKGIFFLLPVTLDFDLWTSPTSLTIDGSRWTIVTHI